MIRYFLLICILFTSLFSSGQDSVRVTLCESSGSNCFGWPSLYKTIDYFDSSGFLFKTSFYNFERCDPDYADTAYLHISDIFYDYDSSGNLLFENQYNFDGDTVVSFHWLLAYTYDSASHQLTQSSTLLYPPTPTSYFDSTSYDMSGNPVYEIRKSWNTDISELDTTYMRIWIYDSLERKIEFDYYSFSSFIFNWINYTHYEYDSASNIISQTYTNSANSDSSRFLSSYDINNKPIETWNQRWDTLVSAWVNTGHGTTDYLTSYHLVKYNFSCADSLCSDTVSKTEYNYDLAGRLTSTESYLYDHPGWTFSGNEYTNYDNWDMITSNGWWEVNFEGCDESNHHEYTYNANHELIHSHGIHYTCDYNETDCDYYALDEDSMLLVLHFDQPVCPFDSVVLNVTVAGGTPPYSYFWFPGYLLSDSTVESPFLIADTTTIFTLKVVDSLGLILTVSDTVFVLPKNIHPVAIISPPACYGEQALLTFDTTGQHEPYIIQWLMNGYNLIQYADTVFVDLPGNYSLNLVDQATGCEIMSASVQPVFLPDPGAHIDLLGDSIFCEGDSVVLQSDIFPSVIWNTGDTSVSIYALLTGNYFAAIVDSNGCADTSNTIAITVHDLPAVNLGTDTLICVNQILNLDAGAGFENYLWQDGSTLQISQVVSASPDTITYSVLVTDSNSCVNGDTIEIIYDACLGQTNLSYAGSIEVFPNPVSRKLIVKGNPLLGNEIKLSIYNALGDKLLTVNRLEPLQLSQSMEIDVSSLSPGIYILEGVSGKNIFRTKFLKK